MLALDVRRRLAEFELVAELSVRPASVTVLVGESGAGKSTLLRMVAGLVAPDAGTIALDGVPLFDAAQGVNVPPERRPVGWVAQDYALFPHLDAFENVAFGLRARRVPGAAIRARVTAQLERMGMSAWAHRRPHALSGGQQQRVALARALVLEPAVLLLDEPLAALDVQTRVTVRAELRRTLAALPCPTLFVTHQPAEALAFGDRIAVLERGALTQEGTRADFVRSPRTAYVAEFLGVNLLEGEIVGPSQSGLVTVQVGQRTIVLADPGRRGRVRLVVHPHDIVLASAAPAGSARNVAHARVEEMLYEPPRGDQVRVRLGGDPPLTALVTRAAADTLGLAPGSDVWASFKATGIEILPD